MFMKRASAVAKIAIGSMVVSAVFAASALAGPTWKFNGESLKGSETVVGAAIESGMTIPGLTTTCEHFLYTMSIENNGGTGEGEITELPLFGCHTSASACTVSAISANTEQPWPTHLEAINGDDYIMIENIDVGILYGGKFCAFGGIMVPVEGTAGGLLNNATETATFDNASFEATGAELRVFEQPIEWNGVFPTEAFEWHRTESLSVG